MYRVDERDTVSPLPDTPQSSVGAPLPAILADEHRLLLAYRVEEPDPDWDGTYATVVDPGHRDMSIAIVDFVRPVLHMFGLPNDEAFAGHPLADRGLRPYAAVEVIGSSWIRAAERMNAVHPSHDRARFLAGLRHFIFTFHDSTFECIAEGLSISLIRGSMRDAVERMVATLDGEPLP